MRHGPRKGNALACFSARAFAGQGGPFCFISPARGPERTAKRQSGEKKRELLPRWLEEERQRRTSPLPQAEQRAKREESERGKIPCRKKAALTGAAAPAPVAVAASARSALLAADARDMSASVRKRASERARGLRAGERGREKRKKKRIWRSKTKKKNVFCCLFRSPPPPLQRLSPPPHPTHPPRTGSLPSFCSIRCFDVFFCISSVCNRRVSFPLLYLSRSLPPTMLAARTMRLTSLQPCCPSRGGCGPASTSAPSSSLAAVPRREHRRRRPRPPSPRPRR